MRDRQDLYVVADLLLAILTFTRSEFPLSEKDFALRDYCYDRAAERFGAHGFDPKRKTNDVLLELLLEVHADDPDYVVALQKLRKTFADSQAS